MFGIGTEELLLILVIALIVLGPERMPRVARDIGRVLGDLRRTSDELREEFLNADRAIAKPIDTTPAAPAAVVGPPSAPAISEPRRGGAVRQGDARGPGASESPARQLIHR